MPGKSYSSASVPAKTARAELTPTVTPCQLPVFVCEPVSALNRVDLPQFGFPARMMRGSLFSADAAPRERRFARVPPNFRFARRTPHGSACGGRERGISPSAPAAHSRNSAAPPRSAACGAAAGDGAMPLSPPEQSATSICSATEPRRAMRTPPASSMNPPRKGAARSMRTCAPRRTLSMFRRAARAGGRCTASTMPLVRADNSDNFIPLLYEGNLPEYSAARLSAALLPCNYAAALRPQTAPPKGAGERRDSADTAKGPPRREGRKYVLCKFARTEALRRPKQSAPLLASVRIYAVHGLHIVAEGTHFRGLADVGCGVKALHCRLLLARELGRNFNSDGDIHVARARARL